MKTKWMAVGYALAAAALGFVSYGMSIHLYIKAQKDLGAARTSAYYSVAPFLGAAFGMVLLGERPGFQFYIGLTVMLAATVLMIRDTMEAGKNGDSVPASEKMHKKGKTSGGKGEKGFSQD